MRVFGFSTRFLNFFSVFLIVVLMFFVGLTIYLILTHKYSLAQYTITTGILLCIWLHITSIHLELRSSS